MTPGGTDESLVPAAQRLGQAVDIAKRVELLVETTCFTVFSYVAQARPLHMATICPHASCLGSASTRACQSQEGRKEGKKGYLSLAISKADQME